MKFELLHIYGPFSIHSYGLFITLGILVSTWLIKKHKQFTQLNLGNKFIEILMISILAALTGGRLLSIVTEPETFNSIFEMFAFWQGGFSILGSVIGILTVIPWYLKKHNIPIFPFLDLASIFAPLLQSISRIGCLFAGCCHGITTNLPWAIRYTDPQSIAPLYTSLHPTQLYSSATLFIIFLIMYFVLQHQLKKSGQLLAAYLILVSSERFIIDFWRADRIFVANLFSFTQLIALALIIFAGTLLIVLRYKKSQKPYSS